MPDEIDYSSLFTDDPASKQAALARALRGEQTRAADTALFSGGALEPYAKMVDEQAKGGLEALGQAQGREIQRLGQERQAFALENELANKQFEHSMQMTRERREQGLADLAAAKADKEIHPPVPEQEGSKLESMKASEPLLDQVEGAWNKFVQTSPMRPVDKAKAYQDYRATLNGSISNIAAGAAPAARENHELMEGFHVKFPTVEQAINPQAAKTFFEAQRNAIRDNLAKQTELLKAGPYNRAQVEQLSKPSTPPAAKAAPVEAPARMPKGAVKTQKNKRTGAVRYLDAQGKEVKGG
jgi:hypothetical protein